MLNKDLIKILETFEQDKDIKMNFEYDEDQILNISKVYFEKRLLFNDCMDGECEHGDESECYKDAISAIILEDSDEKYFNVNDLIFELKKFSLEEEVRADINCTCYLVEDIEWNEEFNCYMIVGAYN